MLGELGPILRALTSTGSSINGSPICNSTVFRGAQVRPSLSGTTETPGTPASTELEADSKSYDAQSLLASPTTTRIGGRLCGRQSPSSFSDA